ncbi:MAG: hypothetical protein L0Z53_00910 [Acidobacteriales bacterium]|nr:hypothetical protein [Terriglobales bacterium]
MPLKTITVREVGAQVELGMNNTTVYTPGFKDTVVGVTPAFCPLTVTFAPGGVELMRKSAAYTDADNATAATMMSITALNARMALSRGSCTKIRCRPSAF